jgi:nicotinic acid mononucleotide adenylyltransferase
MSSVVMTASTITAFKRVKKLKKYYWCILCGDTSKRFDSSTRMMEHHNSVHKRFLNRCGTCEKTFTSISNLIRHQRKENSHSGLRYECEECGEQSKNEVEFDQHRFSIHHISPISPLASVKKELVILFFI